MFNFKNQKAIFDKLKDFLRPEIIHKIFEKSSGFHVKYRTTGKVQFLFSRRFLPALIKFLF